MTEERLDFSEKETVKKRERKALRLRRDRLNGLRHAMSTREGRAFMWWLLGQCGTHRTPFDRQSLQMAFNCGSQNIGYLLEAEISEAGQELYLLMQNEAMSQEKQELQEEKEVTEDE